VKDGALGSLPNATLLALCVLSWPS